MSHQFKILFTREDYASAEKVIEADNEAAALAKAEEILNWNDESIDWKSFNQKTKVEIVS